ncbi:MAG: hypothetical protein FDZ72_16515 [Betaproteobacteria bacterium]|nr:MAG: hypothetical protein FDZ72_16515 [Betaproteobacteria bacterium]
MSGNILQAIGKCCRSSGKIVDDGLLRFVNVSNYMILNVYISSLTLLKSLGRGGFAAGIWLCNGGFFVVGYFLTVFNHHLPF